MHSGTGLPLFSTLQNNLDQDYTVVKSSQLSITCLLQTLTALRFILFSSHDFVKFNNPM